MSMPYRCGICVKTYNKSDMLGKIKCGGDIFYHYQCIVNVFSEFGCICKSGERCSIEGMQAYSLSPKTLETHACLEEMKLIKTELAQFSQNSSKHGEQQVELAAQLKLSIKELSEVNNRSLNELKAQLELISQNKCDLQIKLNNREQTIESLQNVNAKLEDQLSKHKKTVEALSKELIQFKQSSHNTPSKLNKRLADYEINIEALKQEIAQLKLSSSIDCVLAQCSPEIEKTTGSLVKTKEQTSTQQNILLCGSNNAEQSLMKVDTQTELSAMFKNILCLQKMLDGSSKGDHSMQNNSNELNTTLEENENKRFKGLEAQLGDGNNNFMELQKLMNEMKENKNNAKMPSQSANDHDNAKKSRRSDS